METQIYQALESTKKCTLRGRQEWYCGWSSQNSPASSFNQLYSSNTWNYQCTPSRRAPPVWQNGYRSGYTKRTCWNENLEEDEENTKHEIVREDLLVRMMSEEPVKVILVMSNLYIDHALFIENCITSPPPTPRSSVTLCLPILVDALSCFPLPSWHSIKAFLTSSWGSWNN